MFHSGSLQEGIDKALSESKTVICFVTDDGATSREWQTILENDEETKALLQSRAILIRLVAGSQETSFLTEYFPVKEPPNLAIIGHTGNQVLIDTEIDSCDLASTLRDCLGPNPTAEGNDDALATDHMAPNIQGPPSQLTGTRSNQSVQDQLAARRARMEIEKREADERARREKAEQRKARAASSNDPKREQEMKYAKQRRDRLNAEKAERQRILTLIEDDKAERRERETRRRKEAEAQEAEGNEKATKETAAEASKSADGPSCALQIRLFDGQSIRQTFKANSSLAEDVRPWVDERLTGPRPPYTFRSLGSPLKVHNIDATEEMKSLKELGLTPSATLILVAISQFSSAYEGGGSGIFATGYNILASGAGYVGSTLSRVVGGGDATDDSTGKPGESSASSKGADKKITTLADQKKPKDQYYNGNQLNFEPPPDK